MSTGMKIERPEDSRCRGLSYFARRFKYLMRQVRRIGKGAINDEGRV